jgi:serine/threonine-protein kinase PknK
MTGSFHRQDLTPAGRALAVRNCIREDAAYEGLNVAEGEQRKRRQPAEWGPDEPEGYENLVRIDQGGFATIYRARDTRFDRAVALKVLHSENLTDHQLRRFRTECLATGRVSAHPNIVTVYDAGTTRGNRPWLAMEYCSGGSLAGKVAAQGPLAVSDVISIGARLCSALSAAHQAGVLHRDVKPANVLLTSYGEPALGDFGIASVFIEDDTRSIAPETAAYTVVHAAPEILEGQAGSPAADIYSLGSTLYTLLAGKAPFARAASAGLASLVGRIMVNDLPALERPGVPPELEALLRRCMAADPRDRPASAAELGLALDGLGHRFTAVGLDERPRAPRTRTRGRLLIPGIALVALVFTTWGLTRDPPSPGASGYSPRSVAVTQGPDKGELIVSWGLPIRPEVVATVIYQGAGGRAPRAVVRYETSTHALPQARLRGLASGQRVCVSAANLVSKDDVVTNAPSPVVCAVPR